jgi:hypothetical protein
MNEQTEILLNQFSSTDWFSAVGKPFPSESDIVPVSNWLEAAEWCQHPVTTWAVIEARNLLYHFLSSHHYARFIEWNQTARHFLPIVEKLLRSAVEPKIAIRPVPESILNRIQGQLLGALQEAAYLDCHHEIRLFRDLVEYYSQGRLPCGWMVDSPNDFPNNMHVIVF